MFNKVNNPVVIYNKNFMECVLVISFPIKNYREEYLKVLDYVVCGKSGKYNTDKKKYLAVIDNYLLSCNGGISFIGNSPFLEYRLSFPSYNCLGVDVLERNLLFIKELIYDSIDFTEDRIDDIKFVVKGNISRQFKDAFWYYDYKNSELIDENNFLVSRFMKNFDLLDSVTSDSLFEFYKSIISEAPIVFLAGDVPLGSEDIIKRVFLDNKICNICFEKKYDCFCRNISPKTIVTREKTLFKTSALYYTYKVKDMKSDRDRALLMIVKWLISSKDSDVLYDVLRSKNNLVYRCFSDCYLNFGALIIKAFTDKENIDLVCTLYNEIMLKISDVCYISEKLPLFAKQVLIDKKLKREKIWDILFEEVDNFFEHDVDSILQLTLDITSSEVSDFITNRLILTNIYIGEGDSGE